MLKPKKITPKLTPEEVKHIARLANLDLSANEIEKFKEQLGETLDYISHLSKINTSKVTPTAQVTGIENAFREDKVRLSLSQKEALANGSKTKRGYFVVKKIWD